MITVKARPRSSSGAPRWTSSALQTTAAPLPSPRATTQRGATQTFGATAAAPTPSAISADATRRRRRRAARRSSHVPARQAADRRGRCPSPPKSRPKPKSPASNDSFARTTSATLTPRCASIATSRRRARSAARASGGRRAKPSREVAPVAAARGAAPPAAAAPGSGRSAAPRRRTCTALTQYARSGPRRRRARRRASGPSVQRQVLDRLEQRVRARQVLVRDEVRQPRVDRRPEEAGREAGDGRERDDLRRRSSRTGARRRRRAGRGRRRPSAAAREPVDERPEQEPDRDRRQEVGDQQRRDPRARVRPVARRRRRARRARAGARARSRASRGRGSRKLGARAEELELAAGSDGRRTAVERHSAPPSSAGSSAVARAAVRPRRTRSRPACRP